MADVVNNKDQAPVRSDAAARSIRPVIEHALTIYYDGNAKLAREVIDRLLAEEGGQ